jgi:hypothetical protein
VELRARVEADRTTVDIHGIVDLPDRRAATATLRRLLAERPGSALVLRLHDPVVTSSALHVLRETREAADGRGIALSVVVDPLAVRMFRITGLDFLLGPGPCPPSARPV